MDYIRVLDEPFNQFTGSKFSAKMWDGKERSYGKGKTKKFTIEFQDASTLKRLH